MLISFTGSSPLRLVLYLPTNIRGTEIKFTLNSKYSNEDIFRIYDIKCNLGGYVNYEGWCVISFDLIDDRDDLTTKNIGGYYEFRLVEDDVVTYKTLCKVVNEYNDEVIYEGPNEENKQYIYYN